MVLVAPLWLPVVLGLLCSFLFEPLMLRSAVQPVWRRPWASAVVHVGMWLCLFGLFLLLVQRPWFAAATVAVLQGFLLLVNQAKVQSLKEPFLAQDFEYFVDLIKHPRLYIPFFGWVRTILSGGVFIAAVIFGLWLEPVLSMIQWVFAWGVAGCLGGGILWWGSRSLPEPALLPEQDLHRFGQVSFLWVYFIALLRGKPIVADDRFVKTLNHSDADELPHLIAVQSESFFDPREYYACVKPDVLRNYDQVRVQALQQGPLQVPVWGANTARSECAFLTGLTASQLGPYQFNPYRQLAKAGVANLASQLKQAGYRTVCIHPYPASFYQRHRVFPRLGFDRFIDVAEFTENDRDGQYVGDLAVAAKVEQLLTEAQHPLFVFVITMENHGPLHLESDEGLDPGVLYRHPPSAACRDLGVYLRHLRNADAMLQRLTTALKATSRAGYLVWYGDHMPIMEAVYRELGEPDSDTRYIIWSSVAESGNAGSQPIGIQDLATRLVQLAFPQR